MILSKLNILNTSERRLNVSLSVIDYSGKIPDGIYENKIPYGLNKYVPFGNHFVPGAYDACLNLVVKLNTTTIDPGAHKTIAGRWHLMQLKANVTQTYKPESGDQFQDPLERLLTEGLSYKLLTDSVFSKPGLDTKLEKNAVSPRMLTPHRTMHMAQAP